MPDIKVGSQSWSELAKKYGVTVAQLKKANPGIQMLQSGMVVRVPNTPKQPVNANPYNYANAMGNLTQNGSLYNQPSQPGTWEEAKRLAAIPAYALMPALNTSVDMAKFYNNKLSQNTWVQQQQQGAYAMQMARQTGNPVQQYLAATPRDIYNSSLGYATQPQYQNNNPSYRGDEFLSPTPKYYKPPAAPMTVVQRANAYAQQQAQSQANYNARYNTGASALLEGGITTKINNTPFTYYTQGNVAVNQNTGGLVSMKPQTPQNTNVPKPLSYYLTNAQIAKQAERRQQARNPVRVDTTPYFGTTNAMTWKYNG